MKKFTALTLASVLSISVFAGCSNETTSTSETSNGDVVLKVGTHEISTSEYAYALNSAYLSIDEQLGGYLSSGEALIEGMPSKEQSLEDARTYAISILKETYGIKDIISDNNLELTDEDEKEIDEIIEKTKESLGGTQAYKEQLRISGITEDYFRTFYEDQLLFERAAMNVYGNGNLSDEELYALYEDEYYTAKHIFVDTTELLSHTADDGHDHGEDFLETELAKIRAKIDEALAKLNAGEPFDEVADEYSEDFNEPPTGYAYQLGYMPDNFQLAHDMLFENEFSDVIESELGYHIILKTPHTQENFDAHLTTIKLGDGADAIYADLDAKIEAYTVETEPLFDEINFDNMSEYLVTE